MYRDPSDRMYSNESTLLSNVMKWLAPQQRDGIKALRICDRYHKGYSDIFICAKGRFVVAELKDDKGTATPHQKLFIKEMQNAGAIGGVCRTVKDVANLINEALYCKCNIEHDAAHKYCPICGKLVL